MAVSSRILPCRESVADAQPHDDRRDQRAEHQVAFEQVGQRDARQDRVRQRVPQEGHAAQHHVAADDRAQHADHHRGGQSRCMKP